MSFPTNCWYVAAERSEVGRRLVTRTILGNPIALFRSEAGAPIALHDRCPHRFMPLSMGQLVGDDVRCVYHGAQFDPSGVCTGVPGLAQTSARLRVRSYPVIERFGWIWIWPGDPALADPALLPQNALYGDNDGSAWKSSWNCFKSLPVGYQLIGDNLLDITHAQSIHPESFGFPVAELARTMRRGKGPEANVVTYEVDKQRRHISLWLAVDGPLTPYFHEALDRKQRCKADRGNLEFVMHVEWTAPVCFSFHLRFGRVGSRPEERMSLTYLHLLTPETESTTHYYFKACHDTGDDLLTNWANDGAKFIFSQDKVILEAQQLALGKADVWETGVTPVTMHGDELATQARAIIREMQVPTPVTVVESAVERSCTS
jgi:phenylpropionate dioxygenase-like ring-hydroxylating dioxygenase large terminal subunit